MTSSRLVISPTVVLYMLLGACPGSSFMGARFMPREPPIVERSNHVNTDALLNTGRRQEATSNAAPFRGFSRHKIFRSSVKLADNVVPQEPGDPLPSSSSGKESSYNLGLGKNRPVGQEEGSDDSIEEEEDPAAGNLTQFWVVPEPIRKPKMPDMSPTDAAGAVMAATSSAVPFSKSGIHNPQRDDSLLSSSSVRGEFVSTRKMVAKDQASEKLRGAIWDEQHYDTKRATQEGKVDNKVVEPSSTTSTVAPETTVTGSPKGIERPHLFYPDIDMSIPHCVYNDTYDAVWELLRWEAYEEAQREPLLVSFLYSTILNHRSMESSLAFLLANRLSSPMLISTQLQSFILEALESSPEFRRALRADMLAVRDRDPACNCLPDVFLYFKGFQALQAHRVAHCLWALGKTVLAHYLQSAVSNQMQIDIHPNATLGAGIMLDHGTGIVMGETAMVGNNCSILHHVTLGGSGKKGVDRHPKVQDGVLLGAGATVLGNVVIGEGCQVGAGTLVISDLPPHSVAVGVPAKIIGSFIDVTEQPSNEMNQMIGDNLKIATFESFGI